VEKLLGALPVVADLCQRLDLRGIIDRACPVREVATLTHGQVIQALVANRLTSPTPLWRVEEWARAWAVTEVFGIPPEALNDDRIGRALDAIAPNLEQIVGSVGAQAIAAFGVEVARLHWDMTSISLYGAYEDPAEGFIAPRFGHPKDRRPDLKQVQTGLAVSGDGGVPVWHRGYDGGAGEVAQVAGAMRALRKLAGPRRLLLVGDSKLVSYANLRAILAAGVDFIARRPRPTWVPSCWPAWTLRRPLRSTTWPSATPASRQGSGAAPSPGGHHDAARQAQGRSRAQGPPGVRAVQRPRDLLAGSRCSPST
jgi:Domain of unknown function (DUF4277)